MCENLTLRLKRPGMKWDRDHAGPIMMNLIVFYENGQARAYWAELDLYGRLARRLHLVSLPHPPANHWRRSRAGPGLARSFAGNAHSVSPKRHGPDDLVPVRLRHLLWQSQRFCKPSGYLHAV